MGTFKYANGDEAKVEKNYIIIFSSDRKTTTAELMEYFEEQTHNPESLIASFSFFTTPDYEKVFSIKMKNDIQIDILWFGDRDTLLRKVKGYFELTLKRTLIIFDLDHLKTQQEYDDQTYFLFGLFFSPVGNLLAFKKDGLKLEEDENFTPLLTKTIFGKDLKEIFAKLTFFKE